VGSSDSTIHSCNYKSTNILFTDIDIDTVYYGNHTATGYEYAQYRLTCGAGCYPDDFGTLLTNPTDVQTYMVQRVCAFFQNNINGIVNTGTGEFIECPNYRASCVTNDHTCDNSIPCDQH